MTFLWGGSLLVVLGVIVFLGKILGGRLGGSGRTAGRGPELTVLRRTGLGAKQGVATVRFGDKVVLVALGEGGVRFLCEDVYQVVAGAQTASVTDSTFPEDEPLTLEPSHLSEGDEKSGNRKLGPLKGLTARVGPKLFRAPRGLHLLGLVLLCQLVVAGGTTAQTMSAPILELDALGNPTNKIPGAQDMLQQFQALSGLQQPGQLMSRTDSMASLFGGVSGAFGAGQTRFGTQAVPGMNQILEALPLMTLQIGEGKNGEPMRLTGPVGTVLFIGFLTVVPTLLLLMTSFTRILIVLHLLKQAIGAQTVPPAHLLAAMALLLTGFVMAPTLNEVNLTALEPWIEGKIETGEMFHEAIVPFRRFMLANTRTEDLNTFIALRQEPPPLTLNEIPLTVLMTAFVTSELRAAFQIGFALFLPFLVIDLVVASVLMSMGMFMLPPVLVSLPFKLLLFVMVDGWPLVLGGVVRSFAT